MAVPDETRQEFHQDSSRNVNLGHHEIKSMARSFSSHGFGIVGPGQPAILSTLQSEASQEASTA
jgi:hypothetical protein